MTGSRPGTAPAYAVVGGGIVGLAVARELGRRRPGARVIVFEKEPRPAMHQTGHNSGVVHAGIYYRPGSLKAELCTRGRLLLRDFCAERGLPYAEVGKLVVAVDPDELPRLDALERSARSNGVPGLRRIDGAGIAAIEPHAAGLAALHSPATAITDYVAVADALAEDVVSAGGEVRTGCAVTALRRRPGGVEVVVSRPSGEDRTLVEEVIVCAGLQSDRVGAATPTPTPRGGEPGPRIVPFRGEYLAVADAKRELVRGLVYPVPDPRYPFLGVHFTRRVDGSLEIGPNAVLGLDREGYGRADVDVRDLRDVVTWPGFWRLARTHWRTGLDEVAGSLSMRRYLSHAQRYVPEIGVADVRRGHVGVRAQAVARDGTLVDDFVIDRGDRVTRVRNAPSPAATSSLAIAAHVVDLHDRG